MFHWLPRCGGVFGLDLSQIWTSITLPCYPSPMEQPRDESYHEQLALAARMKSEATADPYLAVRLREVAVRHERAAQMLRRGKG